MSTSTTASKDCYKIVLIGDGGVGKTCFLKRHVSGEFEKKYISTIGVEVHIINFNTNYGKITFNIWDCAGQEKFGGCRDSYYINADAAIVFFDLTSRSSFKNINSWISSFVRVCPNAKIVVCGNKCDEKDIKVHPCDIFHLLRKHNYCDVSAKTNHNLEDPFLDLARLLKNTDQLNFIESQVIQREKKNQVSTIQIPKTTESIEELFKLLKKKDSEINELFDLIKDKNLIINKITSTCQNEFYRNKHEKLMTKCFKEMMQKIKEQKDNSFYLVLIKSIKFCDPIYMQAGLDVWTLNKEEFIEKHSDILPMSFTKALLGLYCKSKFDRENILMQNGIFQ